MSFNINSDKEKIRGVNPSLIGNNELTIRGGTGSDEKEILRTELNSDGFARVGINRTGQKVNNITVTAGGTGYSSPPAVTLIGGGGSGATATAFIFNGQVISIAVNTPGSNFSSNPTVQISGGGGTGAAADSALDSVDFELDINGAIRTSTSIISDTARVLNLDVENFVTPNLSLRAPNLKTYVNNTGIVWDANVIVQKDSYRYFGSNVYQALNSGQTSSSAPTHVDGVEENGTVSFKHIGFRVIDPAKYKFSETGDSGEFPRSITPLLGDRSDKIATTEYVLNLATNDVGGRIYVSAQIGSDLNDGRSAVNPVRTIKKAAQLAWSTVGVKETLIVSGGDYVEDNPISLPPDASVVGDNLRLVIIRPANPKKHIFKFGDKNYVTGVTYRDQIDSNGDSVATWDFAMVFDDKQRIIIDNEVNGDFGVDFPIGHQIFGPDEFRVSFSQNTGLAQLVSGRLVKGLNTGSRAKINAVDFTTTTGASAYLAGKVDVRLISGSFLQGEQFQYLTGATPTATTYSTLLTATETDGLNALLLSSDPSGQINPGNFIRLTAGNTASGQAIGGDYEVISIGTSSPYKLTLAPILSTTGWTSDGESISVTAATEIAVSEQTFDSIDISSIRAEGEVVSYDTNITSTLPISRIDFSLQGDPSIATGGFQSDRYGNAEDLGGIVFYTNSLIGRDNTHNFKEGQEIEISGLPTVGPDLSALNGKQRIYKVIEDADGRSRRFVIPKKYTGTNDSNVQPGSFATVKSFSKSVTISLLNSPNSFPIATPRNRRFQDACNLLRNNIDYIADEVVGKINDQFKTDYYSIFNISTEENTFDIYLGTLDHTNTYDSANPTGTVRFNNTSYNITNFVYNTSATGIATVTAADTLINLLSEDDTVQLAGLEISCDAGTKIYPSYSSPTSGSNTGTDGDEQCRQDTRHFVNALIRDLEYGTNYNIIQAAKKYIIDGKIAYIEDEITQCVRAIEYARELCIYAMRNWRIKDGTGADPIYESEWSSISRYFDLTVISTTAGTPVCDDVRSAIDTLSYLWVDIISNNATGTYIDAAYLIARNSDLIADQAYLDTKIQYPSLNLSDVNERKCRRDIKIVIKGLVRDLILGGNHGIVSSAESYFTGTALTGIPEAQRDETIYAFQRVKEYAINAMRNWSDGDVVSTTPTGSTYAPTTGVFTVTFPNLAIIPSLQDRIAFAEGAITYSCAANGGGNDASPYRTDLNFGQSFALTNVSSSGGNTTITANVGVAGSNTDVHTFVSALSNGTKIIYGPVATTSPIPKFEDWSILEDSANPSCANVASTITTAFDLFEDILDGTITSGSTTQTYGVLYNTTNIENVVDNFISDKDGNKITIRADYDDYPIVEASPYTQNASVISFLGGGGALIDGSKVKQPNCPFPGLELDGSASFPNQGKSMVAAAFTIVSFGGTGYKVINDGYTQLVSVFVIFCQDGVLCESGGYASITNSATNFGTFALRGTGFSNEAYSFDAGNGDIFAGTYTRATISQVTSTPTGRTKLRVTNIGREPLEHYVVKIDGFSNTNSDIEYFVDVVEEVTVGPPFSALLTIDDGTGQAMDLTRDSDGNVISTGALLGENIALHRPSIVNSSSHTWEFAGSGNDYNALPENGGVKVEANEQVSEDYGRVYVSGTDELGDFKVGTFARIENRTGNITFTGTVTISEVEFLKLKGGDVVVTGFDASNTLGGSASTDSKLPTQKAVKDYITNNLGPYINKPYSTNAVPRALVELTDSGKISIDQIPALRPFEVFTVADQSERLALEGALAGDIAVQQDTSQSFILNNDLDSLYLAFSVDPTLSFTTSDVFTGSLTNGRIQATEYRKGVVYKINITNGGSGYVSAPTITISGGNPDPGGVSAAATATIANGQVVSVELILFNGYIGGFNYTTAPTITFSAAPSGGTDATGGALVESRLYGNIVNQLKIEDTDTIQDSTTPSNNTVNINRVVNTSSTVANNWVSLSTNQIAAADITSGVIESDRLANSGAANSFTFLRGDQSYALATQSIKGSEVRYFARTTAQANIGASQLQFDTNSNTLIGHEVKTTVLGIQTNTNITGVITAAGITTVSINNPITQTIPLGSIIEFERGGSPISFESTFTQGNFVNNIIISNGGSGYTNGQYFDQPLFGGSGTGLKANITVAGNTVTEVTVTDGGSGYSSDFQTTQAPVSIGSGSSLVLDVKISTVSRQYANVSIDVDRVTNLTISSDLYGTIGVSRFKKSQFTIGESGNGSIDLKVGADSGLDADLLDGQQGSFYTSATNLFSGTIPQDRLQGNYNINVSGSSGNTLRVETGINNPTSSPSPDTFVRGIVSNTIFNTAAGLSDGGNKVQILTFRPGGTGFTVDGGVKQLAFTDNNNMYLRGSGTGVLTFESWAKVWTSLNDGVSSGLDADRLDNKQGQWYQNALNINFGTLSEQRLPRYISQTHFQNAIKIKSTNGDPKYRVYVSGQILDTSPVGTFTPGDTVNLYNINDQAVGVFSIDNVIINDDTIDNFNDYTILIGRLTSGGFQTALKIGSASTNVIFQDFSIEDDNVIDVAQLESDSGTARLRLGRMDGVIATEPSIDFKSSIIPSSTFNSRIVASGGNATEGSGSINIVVDTADSLTVKNQKIWNAGNITFNSTNITETGVIRDANGDFSAGTITASLTGAASSNVLKSGDTMTGSLTLTGATSNLVVGGNSSVTGILDVTNNLTVDTSLFFVDATNDRIGIKTLNPSTSLHVDGDGKVTLEGTNPQIIYRRSSDNTDIIYQEYDVSASTFYTWARNKNINFSTTDTGGKTTNHLHINSTDGKIGVGTESTSVTTLGQVPDLQVEGLLHATGSLVTGPVLNTINSAASVTFLSGATGGSGGRNFRIGSGLGEGNNVFEITASATNGGADWKNTLSTPQDPAIAIRSTDNAVAINFNQFDGTDLTVSPNVNRTYALNVGGDININGNVFQNDAEFVTSRWTESPNSTDIYRGSKVGINFQTAQDPVNELDVNGAIGLTGSLIVNGDALWLDQYGIIKVNRQILAEDITIPANTNASSTGPIEINSGNTVTISSGSSWVIN